jgi:hypothetical protein
MMLEPGDYVLAALACGAVGCLCLLGFLATGTRAAIRYVRRTPEQTS